MTEPKTAFGSMLETALRSRGARGPRRSAVDRAVCIEDLRRLAHRRLPRGVLDYLEGGAEDEVAMRRNMGAFDDLALVPTVLADVGEVDITTTVAGVPMAAPILLAPTGFSRLFHTDGEAAVAAAAADAGLVYSLSTMGTTSIEDVAAVSDGPKWLQLYVWRDRTLVSELIERARAAKYVGLCLTVDTAILGRRERDARNGFSIPPAVSLRAVAEAAIKPMWWWQFLRSDPIVFANVQSRVDPDFDAIGASFVNAQFDPRVTWDDARSISDEWGGAFAIKGIMSGADAVRAVEIGARVVIVSNHGGRQLDQVQGTLAALAEVVDAVDGRAEVVLDGGVRRGTDVVKAIALGARGCMVGRPYLYGLSAGGRKGVDAALRLLMHETRCALALLGCASLADVTRAHVRPDRTTT